MLRSLLSTFLLVVTALVAFQAIILSESVTLRRNKPLRLALGERGSVCDKRQKVTTATLGMAARKNSRVRMQCFRLISNWVVCPLARASLA